MLTVSEGGLGRLTDASGYPIHSRAGQGQINFKIDKYGGVVNVQSVNRDDDLMIITASGMMVRIPLGDISIHARTARGVKIMNLAEDDKIISAVPVSKAMDEDEEADSENTGNEAGEVTERNTEENNNVNE